MSNTYYFKNLHAKNSTFKITNIFYSIIEDNHYLTKMIYRIFVVLFVFISQYNDIFVLQIKAFFQRLTMIATVNG